MFRTPFLLQPSEPDFEPGLADVQAQLVPHDQPDLGDMRAHDVALSHLNARGFIQFHPLLAQRLDDFKAAIFLGHALYWSKHLAQIQPHRKGWFFMSAAQWTQATGLSTREQVSVRSALAARGLLLEALAGRPAVMHFKVDLESTARLLGQPQLTWTSMTELFRACIRFYKPLADICGSVGAGLYLSYLLQRQSFALRNPPAESSTVEMFSGEFVYRPEQARIALCLGIKAQRNAREKLKAAGFIREGRSSHEAVATRVNLAAIASCLQAQGERSIRKSGPRKRPVREASRDLALVSPAGANVPGTAAMLKRADTGLPQRQLNLFTPVGLISKWHFDRVAQDRLALQDDAATLAKPGPASTATPAGLVMSLFAPGRVAQPPSQDAAATSTPSSDGPSIGDRPSKENGPNASRLSTDFDTSGNHDALLSNAIRPFVDPNLPFCRNYIEQGISRYFQTTTARPVDNSASDTPSRRRVEISEITENQKSETAVVQKIDAKASIRTTDVGQIEDGWSANQAAVGPDIPAEALSFSNRRSLEGLIFPNQLDASLRGGVLATLTQAPVELRQAFLDELAGHLANPNKTIHNPAGWLHRLIQRHSEGFVALAMADQVAELRARQLRHQERMAGAGALPTVSSQNDKPSGPQGPGTDLAPEDSEIKRVNRQRLLELKAAFATQQRGGRR